MQLVEEEHVEQPVGQFEQVPLANLMENVEQVSQ
jgi:hypothetical protein